MADETEGDIIVGQLPTMSSKPKRHHAPRGKIREAILNNANSPEPVPLAHLAHELGITNRSVYANVNYMRRKGLLAPATGSAGNKRERIRLNPNKIGLLENTDPNSATSMDAVPIMTEQEALRRLSWTARFGPLALRQQAQKDILASARQSGSRTGPPEPMSVEEKGTELARLMLMSGEEAVRLAIKIAYPKPEDKPQEVVDVAATQARLLDPYGTEGLQDGTQGLGVEQQVELEVRPEIGLEITEGVVSSGGSGDGTMFDLESSPQ